MSDDTTKTICPVHVRLEARVDEIDRRLWRTRHWLIYIAFAAFVASFLGSYTSGELSIARAILVDADEPEQKPPANENKPNNEEQKPLVSWRF